MSYKKGDLKFYLVREDVLPEAMKKTIDAKELLERGKALNVGEAVRQVDLSRSAFYKYKDTVYPFSQIVKDRLVTLVFHLEDRSGTLSQLLGIVANAGCNVLSINQSIPLQGRAVVTLSLNIKEIKVEIEDLLETLKQLEYVESVEILGTGA
ncbi:ACT domain-containing protein [Bacillus sp. FJAT-18017]|uniref:ACT domain-containing protein n=1 Tax=Bacillus sp. FJAT-18017 TaxID=1705566 RepID=UPI0006AF5DAA|nr:ACT domain-containing protein [Bacillus sp. FJAT-18017]ALC89809.1 ACT domain-containing protein [Bacillus sp. FJAT-18017]